jgi:hypothetical protein
MKTAMTDFLRMFHQQDPLLFWSTAYTALLFAVSLAAAVFDDRLVNGTNPWLKPLKFEISIIVFNLTVRWMSTCVGSSLVSAVVAIAMFVEITAIVLQASRGTLSHYNTSSAFNAAVFSSMAVAIVANTLAMTWLLALFFAPQPQLPPAILWGIRLGLLLFLAASLQGFQMVSNRGHTVGAADGGPGLPLLRWSTKAGDLRIAHFIGLHGLQLLPLLGYLLSRSDRQSGSLAVAIAFVLMASAFVGVLRQAWAGRPFIGG